ncbi:MAG: cytosine permease [Firmicutes bacterium]|nr:cytosine permease [Bacillota bacterium]
MVERKDTAHGRQNTTPWRVETHGINVVPDEDRHGGPSHVFWIWFAGNLNITAVVIGAVISSYGLSWFQSLIAMLGLLSFWLVGYFGIPGMRRGKPTMALSAHIFGSVGNKFPSLISWLNLVGWETIMLILGAFAFEGVLVHVLHGVSGPVDRLTSLAVVTVAAFSIAFLGHATIVRMQTIFSYLFGAMTVGIILLLLPHMDWGAIWRHRAGSWTLGVLPAFSIVVAASGLSWVNTASDYTRYLPRSTPGRKVVGATTWGAVIPLAGLTALGIVLASRVPQLATSVNPVAVLLSQLPGWAVIPYLLVSVGGIVASDILDVYSSGLSLLALGVRTPRSRTIFVDAIISIGLATFVLWHAEGFIALFEAVLSLLAGVLAPWAAIFLVETVRGERGMRSAVRLRWPALTAWGVGLLAALLTTSTSLVSGPLAIGVFNGSSLGYLLGFVVAWVIYAFWTRGVHAHGG